MYTSVRKKFTKSGLQNKMKNFLLQNVVRADIFDLDNNLYQRFMLATKEVAIFLNKRLNIKRTAMIMEGMGINHTHIKLYPLSGLQKKFKESWARDRVYFKKYKGYVTS